MTCNHTDRVSSDDASFKLQIARGYVASPTEWCQLASDIRFACRDPDSIVRVAIVIEHDDGAKITFEHDERLRSTE